MVCECRSLVLGIEHVGDQNEPQFYVVSRAFDRFFNYGEKKVPHRIENLIANEKMDGSLVTLFHDGDSWIYRTKSMIMPETTINGFSITWKDVIEEALGDIYKEGLDITGCSLIFEVTSPENRVVTRYQGRKATLLAIRRNGDGSYLPKATVDMLACQFGWERPKTWSFDSWENCLTASKELRNLEEGFVMYNAKGVPVSKVKNPAYVAAHHLRGEGVLTPKRVVDLVLMNEVDEYLSIFPEDSERVLPYVEGYDKLLLNIEADFCQFYAESQCKKDFAFSTCKVPHSAVLFSMYDSAIPQQYKPPTGGFKKGELVIISPKRRLTAQEGFDKLTRNAKQQLIEQSI